MKRLFCLLILIGSSVLAPAQDNSGISSSNKEKHAISKEDKCVEVQDAQNESNNFKLKDNKKYKKAKKDAECIAPYEARQLQPLPKLGIIEIVHLSGRCENGYNPAEGEFVAFLTELQDFYQSNKTQFANIGDRLKKLIGSKDDYQCLFVVEIGAEYLKRPTEFSFDDKGKFNGSLFSLQKNKKQENEYPFTNLGYTCDWYYGDGCRYGLSEFTILNFANAEESKKPKVTNSCSLRNDSNNACLNSVLVSDKTN